MQNSKILMDLLTVINTPVSLSCYIILRYNLQGFFCDALPNVEPINYLDASSYQEDAQAVALLSKNPFYKTDRDTELTCLRTFLDCEVKNRETNYKFISNGFTECETRAVLFTARNIAAKILGSFSLGEPGFGPGSTYSLTGSESNLIRKLGSRLDCTPRSYERVVRMVLTKMPLYAISCGLVTRERTSVRLNKHEVDIIQGDRFLTVPKNYKTDRPICVQPLGNMLYQKAIASTIKKRLKRAGLDIDTAQEKHGLLAKQGSLDDSIVTIDFRSASDTISRELVKAILPETWFDELDSVRTPRTYISESLAERADCDSIIELEKFSAMGNGYTFELETLLFYCIAQAVQYLYQPKAEILSVYGDDVIMSKGVEQIFIRVMKDVGLETNLDKSFTAGPFRESCGQDFFDGFSVRPVYIKDHNENIDGNIYLLNRISDIARRFSFDIYRDKRFKPTWSKILCRVPENFRVYGPEGLGDSVIYGFGGSTKNCLRRYKVIVKKSRSIRASQSQRDLVLACALIGVPSSGIIPRGAKFTLVVRSVTYSARCTVLDWL